MEAAGAADGLFNKTKGMRSRRFRRSKEKKGETDATGTIAQQRIRKAALVLGGCDEKYPCGRNASEGWT